MPYDVIEKSRIMNEVFRSVFGKLIRASKKYEETMRAYYKNPHYRIVYFDYNFTKRTIQIFIDLPGRRPRKPVIYNIYISTQESRKISPAQVTPKIKKLLKLRNKYKGIWSDEATIIYVPAGYTSGARQLIRKYGIIMTKDKNEITQIMAKYWRNRYTQLLAALRGKRLFGELLLLATILREIAKQYQPNLLEYDPLEYYLEQYIDPRILAQQGIEIPAW